MVEKMIFGVWRVLAGTRLVVRDELGNLADEVVEEIQRYHAGAVAHVRQTGKPVKVICRGRVYELNLK